MLLQTTSDIGAQDAQPEREAAIAFAISGPFLNAAAVPPLPKVRGLRRMIGALRWL